MKPSPILFSPLALRRLAIKNRIFVSPMCQYSAESGIPGAWHLVHLGSRAVGGAGLVMAEATAVDPAGRISPADCGIWSDEHARAFRPIVDFIEAQGATAAIQLAHAGRKAGTAEPWKGGRPISDKWDIVAPSELPFSSDYLTPRSMGISDIKAITNRFLEGAKFARSAGFKVVEIHMAHGYLLHEFLSPLTNKRSDEFGGSFENRIKFPLMVANAVRDFWPQEWPVFVRISATDWVEGGWDIDQSVGFCRELKKIGIDFIDVSSGGAVPDAKIPAAPGFQVPFANKIKQNVGILTGAVGLITGGLQAEEVLRNGHADAVLIGREFLRDPYFPLHAAAELGVEIQWPKQYERAR